MNIALVGAESTGKSSLAQALTRELQAALDGMAFSGTVGLVSETLRIWCEHHGRTPHAQEQAQIIDWHENRLAQARQEAGPDGWLVADTTPLMTAVYSQHYFSDDHLYARAYQAQCAFEVTLLMGLDLPWQPDGPWRDGPAVQQAVDGLLRTQLTRMGLPYTTIYGTGLQRTQAALRAVAQVFPAGDVRRNAINSRANNLIPSSANADFRPEFFQQCDACSDPECEHRLFTRLLADRAQGRSTPPR